MTKKKENILNTALQLFSQEGFASVSTNRIAKEANVSEGLIFKHYTNKEGLLTAIMEFGHQQALLIFKDIFYIEDPKTRLKAILSVPFTIPTEEHAFWRLMYQLKWQSDGYNEEMSSEIKEILTKTFHALAYKCPELEAEYAMLLFDGIATSILLKNNTNTTAIQSLIFKKYKL